MRLLLLFLSIFTVLVGLQAPTYAMESDDGANKVKVRLIAERTSIQGGEEIWIGIEQQIAPHWHTYWKNPGDSGSAPQISWDLPEGFEISEIQWPAPHKMPYPPLTNYGYSDSVILLQKLMVPDVLPEGKIELEADFEVLVCKEECIPEYGTYSLSLNDQDALSAQEDNGAYIAAALKKVPVMQGWDASYMQDGSEFVLSVTPSEKLSNIDLDSVAIFPTEWGVVNNSAQAIVSEADGTYVIKQERGERDLSAVKMSEFVLRYEADGQEYTYAFEAGFNNEVMNAAQTGADGQALSIESSGFAGGFLGALIFALIGGLILNLMPCVFPVLSLKALSLVKVAQKHPIEARIHGFAYTFGVILSFLVIAGALLLLKSVGAGIGWGFQLQNPLIVGALAYLLFILGLNLSGVFEFSNPFGNAGGQLANQSGPMGSFFTGILATLVATPCTAPFMAGAIGYAMVQPAYISLSVFAALGFGLALPYLALALFPPLQKILPKPGAWMEVFRQLLAFPMFGAAVWLVWVLGMQTGGGGSAALLSGMVFIAFGIWLMRHSPVKPVRLLIVRVLIVLSFVIAFVAMPKQHSNSVMPHSNSDHDEWYSAYSSEALEQALLSDKPVFVEMTASWCITCKVNHAVAINIDSTKTLFAEEDVQYFVGDWTNEDPEITKFLTRYGRSGVPLYVYYGAPSVDTGQRPDPEVLPQVLTPALIKKTFVQ